MIATNPTASIPTVVPIDRAPVAGPLLLVAETSNDQTLAFLYGLCGWLGETEGISRRYDPIFILTKQGARLASAAQQLVEVEKLTQVTSEEQQEVARAVRDAQAGANTMIGVQVDAFRCPSVASASDAVSAIQHWFRYEHVYDSLRLGPRPSTLLAVSFANVNGAGMRYLTISTGKPVRHGFYTLQGRSIRAEAGRFAAESLFAPSDAMPVEVTDRTSASDRCAAAAGVLCVYRSGKLKLALRTQSSAFFPARELQIGAVDRWRIEREGSGESAELAKLDDRGGEVAMEFLDAGNFTIHVPVFSNDADAKTRDVAIRVRVREQPWLFVPVGELSFDMACRSSLGGLHHAIRKLMRYEYVDPENEPTDCVGPSPDTFASWIRRQVSRLQILSEKSAAEALQRVRNELTALDAPAGFTKQEWNSLLVRVVHSARVRDLAEIAAKQNVVQPRVVLMQLLGSPANDPDKVALTFLVSDVRKWCTTLAEDTYTRRLASSPASAPGVTWREACVEKAVEIAKTVRSQLVKVDQVAGFLVERFERAPFLRGHQDDRIAVVSMTSGGSRTEELAQPPDDSYDRTSTVRVRLQDGTVTSPVPLKVHLDSIDSVNRVQIVVGTSGANQWSDAYLRLVTLIPVASEWLQLGLGGDVATQHSSIYYHVALPIWCHWAPSSNMLRVGCRTVRLVPYVDLGTRFTYRTMDPQTDFLYYAFGLSFSVFKYKAFVLDFHYGRHDGASVGLGLDLSL